MKTKNQIAKRSAWVWIGDKFIKRNVYIIENDDSPEQLQVYLGGNWEKVEPRTWLNYPKNGQVRYGYELRNLYC